MQKHFSKFEKVSFLFYLVAAMFFCLKVPTHNSQYVWFWSLSWNIHGDIFDRVYAEQTGLTLDWKHLGFNQFRLLASFVLFYKLIPTFSSWYRTAFSWLQKNAGIFVFAIYCLFVMLAFLYVPCTTVFRYGNHRIATSDYQWIWQIGAGSVNLAQVFLEQFALFAGFAAGYVILALFVPAIRPNAIWARFFSKT